LYHIVIDTIEKLKSSVKLYIITHKETVMDDIKRDKFVEGAQNILITSQKVHAMFGVPPPEFTTTTIKEDENGRMVIESLSGSKDLGENYLRGSSNLESAKIQQLGTVEREKLRLQEQEQQFHHMQAMEALRLQQIQMGFIALEHNQAQASAQGVIFEMKKQLAGVLLDMHKFTSKLEETTNRIEHKIERFSLEQRVRTQLEHKSPPSEHFRNATSANLEVDYEIIPANSKIRHKVYANLPPAEKIRSDDSMQPAHCVTADIQGNTQDISKQLAASSLKEVNYTLSRTPTEKSTFTRSEVTVLTHEIDTSFVQSDPENKDQIYWEAFDIPFVPDWKRLVNQGLEGLTYSKIAIVRLLHKEVNPPKAYTVIYLNDNAYTEWFRREKEQALLARESVPNLAITYTLSMIDDPAFAHLVSALTYALMLNENNSVYIYEPPLLTINGKLRRGVIQSKSVADLYIVPHDEAEAEVREHLNIFKGSPRKIITNAPTNKFSCSMVDEFIVIQEVQKFF
jgi:hypothetical protein